MKEERKVFAAKSIVDLAENAGLSGKLNTWAGVLKFVWFASCIVLLIAGICNLSSPLGWAMIISAIFQGLLAILYSHLLQAGAVMAEAASIFVLEHKGDEGDIDSIVEETAPFEVNEEVIIIKSGNYAKIKEIKGDEIYLSYGALGDTIKVSASEIKHQL